MCQDTGTAIVKGKKGQQVWTGGGDEEAIARGIFNTYLTSNLRYSQMAPLNMYDEVNTGNNLPAEIKISADRRRRLQVPVHGQGRRQREQELPVPGDQGAAQREDAAAVAVREDEDARHRGLPAVPPRRGHRRHVGGDGRGDGQAGVGPLPRHAAAGRLRARPRVPRHRAGGQGPAAVAADRHRRPVRRQVLLPRRAHHPPAAPRGELSGRHGGVVQRRPPGAGQDHRRRGVPRAAGDRPGAVPARGDARRPRRRAGRGASTSTGRWTRSAPSCRSTR